MHKYSINLKQNRIRHSRAFILHSINYDTALPAMVTAKYATFDTVRSLETEVSICELNASVKSSLTGAASTTIIMIKTIEYASSDQ